MQLLQQWLLHFEFVVVGYVCDTHTEIRFVDTGNLWPLLGILVLLFEQPFLLMKRRKSDLISLIVDGLDYTMQFFV
jgi:hypothetical protein